MTRRDLRVNAVFGAVWAWAFWSGQRHHDMPAWVQGLIIFAGLCLIDIVVHWWRRRRSA